MLLTQNQVDKFSDKIERYNPEIISYPYEGQKRFVVKFKKK